MDVEPLGSPSEFAILLAKHLATLVEPAVPLPTAAQLAALVDATFYASLHEEEARRVEFGIAWQPQAKDCASVVAISPAVAVTPRNLAKLAPATLGEATSIAVRPDGDGLVAWALLERNASAHQPLVVRALAPGVLRVDYNGTARGLYTRGEIHLLGGEHRVKSPAQELTRAFPTWTEAADPIKHVDPRAVVVTRLAVRALAHGHGGMILVMPAEVAHPVGVRVHYGVGEGADVLRDRYAQVIKDVPTEERFARLYGSRSRGADGRVPVRDDVQIAFSEAIELVARLTAIDNALLLDTNLRVRGFGVQVVEGEAPKNIFQHANPYSDDVHVDDLSTFKGTRHPAGVLFCMRQHREAAAIIASQDGNLSLVIKDAHGGVDVLGSYQHTFGWR